MRLGVLLQFCLLMHLDVLPILLPLLLRLGVFLLFNLLQLRLRLSIILSLALPGCRGIPLCAVVLQRCPQQPAAAR